MFVSLATLWELAIKESLGRLQSRRPLDVRLPHVRRLTALPRLHGDLFDRMLVAQAIEERCVLVTRDRAVQGYPVELLW